MTPFLIALENERRSHAVLEAAAAGDRGRVLTEWAQLAALAASHPRHAASLLVATCWQWAHYVAAATVGDGPIGCEITNLDRSPVIGGLTPEGDALHRVAALIAAAGNGDYVGFRATLLAGGPGGEQHRAAVRLLGIAAAVARAEAAA